jgi:hypothetical protein
MYYFLNSSHFSELKNFSPLILRKNADAEAVSFAQSFLLSIILVYELQNNFEIK